MKNATLVIIFLFIISIAASAYYFAGSETDVTGNVIRLNLKNVFNKFIVQPTHETIKNPATTTSSNLPSDFVNELALEKQFEDEDEKAIKAIYPLSTMKALGKPKLISKSKSVSLRRTSRPAIPVSEKPAYGFGLREGSKPELASVDLTKYLWFMNSHREIFEKMIWVSPSNYPAGESIIYSQGKMWELSYELALLETGRNLSSRRPPEGRLANVILDGVRTGSTTRVYSENEALRMYLPHIAVSLYTEVNHIIPWSITGYSDFEQELLLDGRKFITYDYENVEGGGYRFVPNSDGSGMTSVTDWNPFISYRFLESKDMIKDTQRETIYSLTQWMRQNLIHELGAEHDRNAALYGYAGAYPVDKILYPPAGAEHWTVGCYGTTSLYASLLRTVNIPLTWNFTMGSHVSPVFITSNLALGHGDDPYTSYNKRALQEVPVDEIFYTIDGFYAMNHAPVEAYSVGPSGPTIVPSASAQASFNNEKRIIQTAYNHMAYPLLRTRALDVLMSTNVLQDRLEHPCFGLGSESFCFVGKPLFDNVPEMLMAMDDEITRIGGGDYRTGNRIIYEGLISPES